MAGAGQQTQRLNGKDPHHGGEWVNRLQGPIRPPTWRGRVSGLWTHWKDPIVAGAGQQTPRLNVKDPHRGQEANSSWKYWETNPQSHHEHGGSTSTWRQRAQDYRAITPLSTTVHTARRACRPMSRTIATAATTATATALATATRT